MGGKCFKKMKGIKKCFGVSVDLLKLAFILKRLVSKMESLMLRIDIMHLPEIFTWAEVVASPRAFLAVHV